MQWSPPPQKISRPRQVHGARTAEEFMQMAVAYGERFELFDGLRNIEEQPIAYINHGEWHVDCVDCGNWPAADPEWKLAVCFQCGAAYHPEFPPDIAAIEATLLKRPDRRNRNWRPQAGETLATLEAENTDHGVS